MAGVKEHPAGVDFQAPVITLPPPFTVPPAGAEEAGALAEELHQQGLEGLPEETPPEGAVEQPEEPAPEADAPAPATAARRSRRRRSKR